MNRASSSKATKKRKTGSLDPSQRRLDRFLSQTSSPSPRDAKNDPMQIDSNTPSAERNPILGTFEQQTLVPKITIVNIDPSRQTEVSDIDFNNCWGIQHLLIEGIFSAKNNTNINYITVAKLSESLCRFGKSKEVYEALQGEIVDHVKQIRTTLLSIPLDVDLLSRLDTSWKTFCKQLTVLRNVYMELDRAYVLPNTRFSSIIHMGKHLFSENIMDSEDFYTVVIAEVLKMIKRDRDGTLVDTDLIRDVLLMLSELSYYASDFEPRFLTNTNNYYKEEANQLIQTLSIPEYIQHAAVRRTQELDERIGKYLSVHTKQALLSAVTRQLVYTKTEQIISKGLNEMLEEDMYKPLQTFYELLERSSHMNILRSAFGKYIKSEGVKGIKDPKNDPSMIMFLLNFRRKMDAILKNCFNNDPTFINTSKESFEYFINTRGNKPAELLAKFIDAKLKISLKKQQRAQTAESEAATLDSALVLFRYIQAKDAFEAYYKRFLSKRLLMDRSSSSELENRVLENLKLECGHEFTKNMENMFNDIQVSSDLSAQFKEDSKSKSRLPMSIKVIAQANWPTYSSLAINVPPNMLASQKLFESFYTGKFNGRRLVWQNSLSSCSLLARYPNGKKEIVSSLAQAVVLLLFNDIKKKSISFSKMQQVTGLDKGDLRGILVSLSTGTCQLLKNESGEEGVTFDDRFSFNTDFKSSSPRMRIPAATTEQAKGERKDVEEKVQVNRQHQLEAAIVRIMKAKKTMEHSELVSEIFAQLKYPVEASDVKKRIESLIDRDYIIRDKEHSSIYVYQS